MTAAGIPTTPKCFAGKLASVMARRYTIHIMDQGKERYGSQIFTASVPRLPWTNAHMEAGSRESHDNALPMQMTHPSIAMVLVSLTWDYVNSHYSKYIKCNQAGYSGARVRLNISVYCLGFASQYRALWLPSATN